jgi:hypothetical protein
MVQAADLVRLLRRRGVQLVVVGDELRYRPVSAVTSELRAALVAHKAEVARLLEYEAAAYEYDYLGAKVDVLTDQAALARQQGDQLRATRLPNEARQLVEGDYRRAGQRMAALWCDGYAEPDQDGPGAPDPQTAG